MVLWCWVDVHTVLVVDASQWVIFGVYKLQGTIVCFSFNVVMSWWFALFFGLSWGVSPSFGSALSSVFYFGGAHFGVLLLWCGVWAMVHLGLVSPSNISLSFFPEALLISLLLG